MMVCRRRSAINLGLTYMISKAQDLWKTLQPHLEPYYRAAEREFNTRTSDFNFVLFCLLYSILFVFLVRCCTPRQRRWRPRNKELKSTPPITQPPERNSRKVSTPLSSPSRSSRASSTASFNNLSRRRKLAFWKACTSTGTIVKSRPCPSTA